MIIVRAKTAGFCMGVDLALKKLDRIVENPGGKRIYTLGPIIHNPQVLDEYERLGVKRVSDPDEIPSGGQAVIRAHGIPRNVEERLRGRNVTIVDATCPRVKRAQTLIYGQTRKGGRLLLFGENEHPEVKGLKSYANDDAIVFESLDKLKEIDLPRGDDFFLAAQTTQDRKGFEEVVKFLRQRLERDIPVFETICDATRERQQEALTLAGQVDAVIVAGGFESGNTRRLYHVVESQGVFCLHVETADQIPIDKIRKYKKIGLTAGASTPRKTVDDIEALLKPL